MKILTHSIKNQSGFTLMGWIIIMLIGGFYAYLGMLLFPVVISNYTMGTILTSLQAEPGITQKSKREIISLVNKRLRINGVVDVKTSDFEVVREDKDRVTVYLDYDNKIEFAKNVYILIENHKLVELTRN